MYRGPKGIVFCILTSVVAATGTTRLNFWLPRPRGGWYWPHVSPFLASSHAWGLVLAPRFSIFGRVGLATGPCALGPGGEECRANAYAPSQKDLPSPHLTATHPQGRAIKH